MTELVWRTLVRRSWLSSIALALASMGCAGSQDFDAAFTGGWTYDQGRLARRVLTRLGPPAEKKHQPAAVGVSGRTIVGQTLPDGKPWTFDVEVDTLPAVDGAVVAFSGGGRVHLLDLSTGKPVWPEPISSRGRHLESMADDGETTLLVLADPDDSRRDLLLTVNRGGRTVYRTEPEPALGRPGALDGVGLVPFSAQYIAALDLREGDSIGRIMSRNAPTSVVIDDVITFRGHGAVPFDEALARDPDLKPLTIQLADFPGKPTWPDGGTVTPLPESRPIALYAHPEATQGGLKFSGDVYVATYYRVALGFDAKSGELRWVNYFVRDVLAGAASATGVTLCFQDGTVETVSYRDGARQRVGNLDSRIKACSVEADPRPVEARRELPLTEQIVDTLTSTGPEMAPIHDLLLDELTSHDDPEVTRLLIEVAQSPRASAALADDAGRRLAQRRSGAEFMIGALREKPEISEAKRPPPLLALAAALGAMKSKEAAPVLASYLLEPSSSIQDQLAILNALRVIGTEEQSDTLLEYFDLYRSTTAEPEWTHAMIIAAQILLKNGPEAARERVRAASQDLMTHPRLRPELQKMVDKTNPGHKGNEASGPGTPAATSPEAGPKPGPSPSPPSSVQPTPPSDSTDGPTQ